MSQISEKYRKVLRQSRVAEWRWLHERVRGEMYATAREDEVQTRGYGTGIAMIACAIIHLLLWNKGHSAIDAGQLTALTHDGMDNLLKVVALFEVGGSLGFGWLAGRLQALDRSLQ